jgi:uncharacterized repeat protein (TIGR01451 family)
VGLAVAIAFAVAGLLLSLAQTARGDVAALEGSTKSASSDVVYPGDLLTYTIIISNTGPVITSTVFVTDVLPTAVTYVSHAAPTNVLSGTAGQLVTFTLPLLDEGASVVLELVAQVGDGVAPGTVFTNTAVIDDHTTVVEPSVVVTVAAPPQFVYFPIIMKRWPPIPYPPTLSLTSNDNRGNYTLGWSPGQGGVTAPASYWIQEARDTVFTNLVTDQALPLSPTSFSVTNRSGTLYYRVAGVNSYGRGEWSNVVPVVTGYSDDFSNPASGWYVGTAERWNNRGDLINPDWRLETVAYMSYVPGHYRINVPMDVRGGGDAVTWFVWPAQMAPLPVGSVPLPDSYCVEARAIFSNSTGPFTPWWAHWGIVFGANSGQSDSTLTEIYTFQVNSHYKLGILRYQNYTYPGDRQPLSGLPINVETSLYNWPGTINHWSEQGYGNPANMYNTLKVWVHGDKVDVYINGARIVTADIPGMPRAGVGVIAGDWEVTPVITDFDYFRYDPACTGP